MRTSIHLSIPKPCYEDWNNMSPNEKGRYCCACEKTVYDFTNKTDEYIVKSFKKNGQVCGRFKSTQLDRELAYSAKESRHYFSYAASALFAFVALGTNNAAAQGQNNLIKETSISPNPAKGKMAQSILKEKVISGTILDEAGLPLPGVTICIIGTDKKTQSDFDGFFKLKVSKNTFLKASYIGYHSEKTTVTEKREYNFKMNINEHDCNSVVIVAGYPERHNNWKKKDERKEQKILKTQKRNDKREKIRNKNLKRTRLGQLLFKMTSIFRNRE
ncbi:carboxypeptidase-like regulatory domain-containing protein [Lacinutrix sp. Hel_I_90]|uniref:carboxypeptidase-like regulatory domain-containing protein n=1 Tax=Lacinutrix sp. Hel_I_90 TaxID=1249999 RepID=UPI0005CADF9B|nr:carboxypeptidase-like regulatory domain-containing protein [Lacinutrix sp. Hel_I_90]